MESTKHPYLVTSTAQQLVDIAEMSAVTNSPIVVDDVLDELLRRQRNRTARGKNPSRALELAIMRVRALPGARFRSLVAKALTAGESGAPKFDADNPF